MNLCQSKKLQNENSSNPLWSFHKRVELKRDGDSGQGRKTHEMGHGILNTPKIKLTRIGTHSWSVKR